MKNIQKVLRYLLLSLMCPLFLSALNSQHLVAQIGEVEILTLIGGEERGEEERTGISSILVDSTRGVLLCLVWTNTKDLITTEDALQKECPSKYDFSAYFVLYDLEGSSILYASYLAGSSVDVPYSMCWDESGENIILAGSTRSNDFPITPNAMQKRRKGPQDFWYARFDMDRREFTFITYLGGNGLEGDGYASIASDGRMLIAGYTDSRDLPQKSSSFSRAPDISGDPAVLVLRNDTLLYAVCISGKSDGEVEAVIENDSSFVFVGTSWSSDTPVTPNAFQRTFGGVEDIFILRTDKEFRSIEYCSYLGGASNDRVHAVRYIDGQVHIVGRAFGNSRFPLTQPALGYDTIGCCSAVYAIYNPANDSVPLSLLIIGHGQESIDDLMSIDKNRVLLLLASNSDSLLGMNKQVPGEYDIQMQLIVEFDLSEAKTGRIQYVWDNSRGFYAGRFVRSHYGTYFIAGVDQQVRVAACGARTTYSGGWEVLIARLRIHTASAFPPPPAPPRLVTIAPYPNPSRGPATVLFSAPRGGYTLRLYGGDGRVYMTRSIIQGAVSSSVPVALSSLASGRYHLVAYDKDGLPVARSSLVVW